MNYLSSENPSLLESILSSISCTVIPAVQLFLILTAPACNHLPTSATSVFYSNSAPTYCIPTFSRILMTIPIG